jgi:hypothetical protein
MGQVMEAYAHLAHDFPNALERAVMEWQHEHTVSWDPSAATATAAFYPIRGRNIIASRARVNLEFLRRPPRRDQNPFAVGGSADNAVVIEDDGGMGRGVEEEANAVASSGGEDDGEDEGMGGEAADAVVISDDEDEEDDQDEEGMGGGVVVIIDDENDGME